VHGLPQCWLCGLQESPLRRRLFCGGCSRVEYQRIDFLLAVSMPVRCPLCGGAWTVWGLSGGLLFGTLLGPEATGTGSFGPVFVCFWFPAQSGSGPR
jgi:hypothetical protein